MNGYEQAEAALTTPVETVAEVTEVQAEPEKPKVRACARRMALTAVENYKAKVHRNVIQNIGYYTKYIESEANRLKGLDEEAAEKSEAYALAWSLVLDAGFKPEAASWPDWTIDVNLKESQLPRLAKVVGRLKVEEAEKSIVDREKGIIRITARCAEHDMIRVSWNHKLTETDSCKIVKVEREELVCEVGK